MPVLSLHHVQVAMPPEGEAQARRFYGDVLGLTEVTKPPHLARRGGAWFQVGSQQLHLGVEPDFRPATKAHPAFQVVGLSDLRRRLQEQGVETWEDEPLEGFHRFYVRDPFGNRLEFLEAAR